MILNNIYSQIETIAKILYEKEWAEANAGNISINISELYTPPKTRIFVDYNLNNLIHIRNKTFLITGAGKRMREIANNAKKNTCIITISDSLNGYYINSNVKPSSELISHLMMYNNFAKINNKRKAIIHAHPTEIITLSNIDKFMDENYLNKLLFSKHTEVKMFLSEGIGLLPVLQPGSKILAKQTANKMKKYKICIWEKHGCISSGNDLNQALDYIEILNKMCKIILDLP